MKQLCTATRRRTTLITLVATIWQRHETNLGYATILFSYRWRGVRAGLWRKEQTVAASFSTPTLFTIANDLTDMRVIADVDEADIGDVQEGQRVTFTVDAFPNDTFEGKVTQVRQEATTTSNVVTYEVVVSAPNPDLKLKPGLTANITIYTLEKNNVLSVPAKALRFTPERELSVRRTKWLMLRVNISYGTPRQYVQAAHAVTVGISNGVMTEITGGISEGDVIITGATSGKMPGDSASASQGDSGTQKESSPFMPSRPGSKKK
jgi:HlyD family secretion protein